MRLSPCSCGWSRGRRPRPVSPRAECAPVLLEGGRGGVRDRLVAGRCRCKGEQASQPAEGTTAYAFRNYRGGEAGAGASDRATALLDTRSTSHEGCVRDGAVCEPPVPHTVCECMDIVVRCGGCEGEGRTLVAGVHRATHTRTERQCMAAMGAACGGGQARRAGARMAGSSGGGRTAVRA